MSLLQLEYISYHAQKFREIVSKFEKPLLKQVQIKRRQLALIHAPCFYHICEEVCRREKASVRVCPENAGLGVLIPPGTH